MSTPEANFWKTIKKNLPPKAFATRIENRHGGGIPDVHIIWDNLPFWLELKITKANAVNLSPHQIAWNTAYFHRGGLNFILVKRVGERGLFLFEGGRASEVKEQGLKLKPLFQGSSFEDLWSTIRGQGLSRSIRVSGISGSG